MTRKFLSFFAVVIVVLTGARTGPPATSDWADFSQTGQITYRNHKWSFQAKVVRIEQVSALGSRGHAALLTYFKESSGNAGYAWALLDLKGYDFHAADGDVTTGQNVVVYVSGDYVDERGINYDLCAKESGDYCAVLRLVEGAYLKSIDLYDLPASPGNKLIHHGSSSRNWWNGMLVWKIAAQ